MKHTSVWVAHAHIIELYTTTQLVYWTVYYYTISILNCIHVLLCK